MIKEVICYIYTLLWPLLQYYLFVVGDVRDVCSGQTVRMTQTKKHFSGTTTKTNRPRYITSSRMLLALWTCRAACRMSTWSFNFFISQFDERVSIKRNWRNEACWPGLQKGEIGFLEKSFFIIFRVMDFTENYIRVQFMICIGKLNKNSTLQSSRKGCRKLSFFVSGQ